LKLPSRKTQDLVENLGSYVRAKKANENLSKHALMNYCHNNHTITDEEFEIYSKSRKNLIILQGIIPLIVFIIAFCIICYIMPSGPDFFLLAAALALFIWLLAIVICCGISLFTKSRKYLYLYDKWYATSGGSTSDLHIIFSPDGWKDVSNANAIIEFACLMALTIGIIIFTIVANP
jgi:hypothetical protein